MSDRCHACGQLIEAGTPLLAKQERAAFDFIAEHIAITGSAPTLKQIAARLGRSSPSAAYQIVGRLERKGYIRRRHQAKRSIELVQEARV